MDEARAQLMELRGDQPWPPLVVLLGTGLGYAVDVIEAEAPAETKVMVIEPFTASAAMAQICTLSAIAISPIGSRCDRVHGIYPQITQILLVGPEHSRRI